MIIRKLKTFLKYRHNIQDTLPLDTRFKLNIQNIFILSPGRHGNNI